MKKISPTCAMTTTALLALAGLAAAAPAQSDAQATPAPASQQPIGPNGVPVAQQAPLMLRPTRPLLKPAMIDLDELAKQPRLKPGMQRRLPGVKVPAGDPALSLPGVTSLNPSPLPAVESVTPSVPGEVPVILPDQPRKRPEGWSVKPEEPVDDATTPAVDPAMNVPVVASLPGVRAEEPATAAAAPTVTEIVPSFAFPEGVNAAAPSATVAVVPSEVPVDPSTSTTAPASTSTVAGSATSTLGPSRLTAFGSGDVATSLPPTGVSMPSDIVGTMPVPPGASSQARTPQIEQSTSAFNTPVMRDPSFTSNMPVVSDRTPSSVSIATTQLDENGLPLRPAVLPPEVREITVSGTTLPEVPASPAEPAAPAETPVVAALPATSFAPEPQPVPAPVVEMPAVPSTAAASPAEVPAPSEPAVVVTTVESPAAAPAPEPTPVPESAPMPAPLPGLTFRKPEPVAAPSTTVTPAAEPVKPEPVNVATTDAPSEPAATTPATPEPTFSNAVSAAAAKLAERAAAASTTTEPVAPATITTSAPEVEAKLATQAAPQSQTQVPQPEVPQTPAIATTAPASTPPVAETAAPAQAPQPEVPQTAPAIAIAADSGKPVEVLPAPTAGSAQDPFTAKGDGVSIRVTELTGTPGMVQWLRDGGNDWQIPELNEAGKGKYTIRTGPDAGALVSINETTKLRVGRLSRAEVRAMSLDAPGAQRRVVVALTRGRVAVIPAPGTAVNVYTPQSLVVVREPTEVIHDTASGTRTVAYVEKSPASAEVMTTP